MHAETLLHAETPPREGSVGHGGVIRHGDMDAARECETRILFRVGSGASTPWVSKGGNMPIVAKSESALVEYVAGWTVALGQTRNRSVAASAALLVLDFITGNAAIRTARTRGGSPTGEVEEDHTCI